LLRREVNEQQKTLAWRQCGECLYHYFWRQVQMGFFDLQVNGFGGCDFNAEHLHAQSIEAISERLLQEGVDGILVTLITDSIPSMARRLQGLVRLRQSLPSFRKVMRGFHIEGPFLNPADGYRGAHPRDAILMADRSVMQELLDAGDGLVRLVTLAPECDPGLKVTRMLSDNGVVVSAGHTDASLETLKGAINAGLTMFTHLGNGCPAVLPRHDNILQRVLSLRERLWLCFIADGTHIPLFALKTYLDLVGTERTIVVTDAMSGAGCSPGKYWLGRLELDIGDDLVARSPDGFHLAGSTITMERSLANLTEKLGVSQQAAWKLVEENPRRAIREPDEAELRGENPV
jgi:N-acetylglucosamine-6-phosphate deacetylase